MIRVAIDAEHIRHSRAGIARYAECLVEALTNRQDIDVFEVGGGPTVRRGTVRKKLLTLRQDLIWYPLFARDDAYEQGAEVYHSPLPRGPLSRGKIPFVMTVHDLVPLLWPETMSTWNRIYMRLTLQKLVDTADLIFTPSQSTADDVNVLLGVSPARIRVIPNGVSRQFFETAAHVANDRPYVLFVGTPEPRKNLPRLLEAMALLHKRGYRERLVLVGDGGWGENIPLPEFVVRKGRVSDADLHVLYANAACVALPSLHEGFGIPAVEAMASGVPVVASTSGALPEVTGGAAVLVDPLSPVAIADGIAQALNERDRLIPLGRARAEQFSWERTAEMTARAYREVAHTAR